MESNLGAWNLGHSKLGQWSTDRLEQELIASGGGSSNPTDHVDPTRRSGGIVPTSTRFHS